MPETTTEQQRNKQIITTQDGMLLCLPPQSPNLKDLLPRIEFNQKLNRALIISTLCLATLFTIFYMHQLSTTKRTFPQLPPIVSTSTALHTKTDQTPTPTPIIVTGNFFFETRKTPLLDIYSLDGEYLCTIQLDNSIIFGTTQLLTFMENSVFALTSTGHLLSCNAHQGGSGVAPVLAGSALMPNEPVLLQISIPFGNTDIIPRF